MPQVRMIADKVRLVSVATDSFKTGRITVSMALPMDEKMAANSLLIYLLKRSCKEYPDFSLLNGKLDELYMRSRNYAHVKEVLTQCALTSYFFDMCRLPLLYFT